MSNDLPWTPPEQYDPGLERIKPFTEPLWPVAASSSESHLQEFASVIENVIVPRLLMSHAHGQERVSVRKAKLDDAGVRDFVEMTMQEEPDSAINFIHGLLEGGVPFQDILLKLMAPAARELGERWVHDSATFVQVTLGVARMHRILREFDGVPEHLWSQRGLGRKVLLLPTPGEQHTFGLRLVQEFLLRESWDVTNSPVMTVADLGRLVAARKFDVVGLSLSGETLINALRDAICEIRIRTKQPDIRIIVGGQIFADNPGLAASLGADACATDAASAVMLVNEWAGEAPVLA